MPKKHHVVALDAWIEPPEFDFDTDVTVIRDASAGSNPEQLRDATIMMLSGTPLTREMMDHAPNLELVACNGTGVNHVDQEYIRQRGITLCKVPAQNAESVSEHAFALYFALRRRIMPLHHLTMEGKKWPEQKTVHREFKAAPRTNAEEIMVGMAVGKMAKALGMKVLVAERKAVSVVRSGRTSFDEAIRQATVFIFVTPLDESTRNMIDRPELDAMNETALLVNVGRGGVINEAALAEALRAGRIGGAATDVFEKEPAGKDDSPLLDPSIPDLIVSPHIAWYSQRTMDGTLVTIKRNIDGFVAGTPQNVVISGSRR